MSKQSIDSDNSGQLPTDVANTGEPPEKGEPMTKGQVAGVFAIIATVVGIVTLPLYEMPLARVVQADDKALVEEFAVAAGARADQLCGGGHGWGAEIYDNITDLAEFGLIYRNSQYSYAELADVLERLQAQNIVIQPIMDYDSSVNAEFTRGAHGGPHTLALGTMAKYKYDTLPEFIEDVLAEGARLAPGERFVLHSWSDTEDQIVKLAPDAQEYHVRGKDGNPFTEAKVFSAVPDVCPL